MKSGLTMAVSRCPHSGHTANPSCGPMTTGRLQGRVEAAGDPAAAPVVPLFNGEQHAGIQVLSTAGFPVNAGPLSRVHRRAAQLPPAPSARS
jgi:hypothetical protein